jgi:hypothetical protein
MEGKWALASAFFFLRCGRRAIQKNFDVADSAAAQALLRSRYLVQQCCTNVALHNFATAQLVGDARLTLDNGRSQSAPDECNQMSSYDLTIFLNAAMMCTFRERDV